MKRNKLFEKLAKQLKNLKLFVPVTKKLPGKWQLFEYYVDSKEGLLHFTETGLVQSKTLLVISFLSNEEFLLGGKFPVALMESFFEGKWSISRNYITFIHPKEFRNNVEFQFAFEKGNLKLLKKDAMGNIEFFGFFKPVDDKKKNPA